MPFVLLGVCERLFVDREVVFDERMDIALACIVRKLALALGGPCEVPCVGESWICYNRRY